MEILFFFVMVFSGAGQLQEVTASPMFKSYAVCVKERERIYYQVPVTQGASRRVVTPCHSMNVTALPRCQ